MKEKQILTFRICKEGFQQLLSGKSKFRYREVKPYWESRLLNKDGSPKYFDVIHIKNGYKDTSPLAIVKYKKFHGIIEYEGKNCFKIELGNIIEVKNYLG